MSVWRNILSRMGLARKSLDFADPSTQAFFLGFSGSSERVGRSYVSQVRNGYEQLVAIYRGVSDMAIGAASVPVDVFINGRKEPDHELAQLLANPNPRESGPEFLEQFFTYYKLAGNSFVSVMELVDGAGGAPISLEVLRPDKVEVTRALAGLMGATKYVYRPDTPFPARGWTIADDEAAPAIVHWRTLNPLGGPLGLSPMLPAMSAINRGNLVNEWNENLMRNGCKPGGGLFVKSGDDKRTTLTDDERAALRESLDQISGAKNTGRPWVFEGGVEWQEMQLTPVEADWTGAASAAARDACNAIGYPFVLLLGDGTSQNQREARLALWENTIIPMMAHGYPKLARALAPRYGISPGKLELRPNLDQVPALALRRERSWERVKNADWISENEARAETGIGLSDDPNADAIRISYHRIPLDAVSVAEQPAKPAPGAPPSPAAPTNQPGKSLEELRVDRLELAVRALEAKART